LPEELRPSGCASLLDYSEFVILQDVKPSSPLLSPSPHARMIDAIHQFFELNDEIILFIYGQVFFVLGLAITLQSLRYSRLPLARRLHWLAAFGYAHALNEWGDIFIPIQAQYLPSPIIHLLTTAQTVILAMSFAFLFQFGVESLRPLPGRWRYVRFLPLGMFLLWLFWVVGPALTVAQPGHLEAWHRDSAVMARYFLGIPGAVVAAYSLRSQAQKAIAPFNMPDIISMLRLAGLALLGYAFFGGFIVPAAPFFPASVFNQENLQALTLLPVQVYRSLLGLVLAYAILRSLQVFHVELDRHIAGMEETQILLAERERIGRELHDGTLQTVYASGLLLQSAHRNIAKKNCREAAAFVQQAMAHLDQAVADIRRHLGQLQVRSSGQSLAEGLREVVAASALDSFAEVTLRLDLPPDMALSSLQVGHLLAIANESLSNIIRHAHASHVQITAGLEENARLFLQIEDDGVGLPKDLTPGYGLYNMRDRALLLNGDIIVRNRPDRGALVRVEIPIGEKDETFTAFVGG